MVITSANPWTRGLASFWSRPSILQLPSQQRTTNSPFPDVRCTPEVAGFWPRLWSRVCPRSRLAPRPRKTPGSRPVLVRTWMPGEVGMKTSVTRGDIIKRDLIRGPADYVSWWLVLYRWEWVSGKVYTYNIDILLIVDGYIDRLLNVKGLLSFIKLNIDQIIK